MISTGILLAAGEGSRLRSAAPLKPLCNVAGRTLLEHALRGFATAGLKRAIVVVGYGADEVVAHIEGTPWPIEVVAVANRDFHLPNGTSVLAAEPYVAMEEALLAMCDHLVDPALYRLVADTGASGGASLAVDRRVESGWVDIDDVTRVRTSEGRIVEIGKGIDCYDCFDTGVFAIGERMFAALRSLEAPSLTEGMRVLASRGAAFVIDCGELRWIDVDDESALQKAEIWIASESGIRSFA
jgi:choline kinase